MLSNTWNIWNIDSLTPAQCCSHFSRWPVWADLAGKWPDLMTSTKDAPKLPYTKKTSINGKIINFMVVYLCFTSIMENHDISLGIAMVWTLDCTLNTWNATKVNLLKGETDPVLGVPWFRISFQDGKLTPKDPIWLGCSSCTTSTITWISSGNMQPWLCGPPGVDTPAALF